MLEVIFWISIIILIYIYFGYLGISIFLGALLGKPVIKKDIYPTVSLIIAAYNEEKVIKEKLENSLNLDYPKEKLEIIVASESTDATDSIVSSCIPRGVVLYAYPSRQGKSSIVFETVSKVKGDIVVFSDANAIYEKDAIKKLVRNFYDTSVGGVLGRLVISNPQDSSISHGESIYKKYEAVLRKYNSRVGSVLGADGSMLAIRRELYAPLNKTRGDDFELAIRVLIKGRGVVFEPEAISYEEASTVSKDEINRKIRMVSWFFKSSFIFLKEMLWPLRPLLIWQLFSNKILRWLSPWFLIILFFSNLYLTKIHPFYAWTLAGQIIFYILGIIGECYLKIGKKKEPNKIVRLVHFFCVFNYAFLVGTLRAFFFKAEPTWEKVRG